MNLFAEATPVRRVASPLLLAVLVLSQAALATPSQSPLTARSATPPPPNLMVTLDDSGSMLFDFMPEESYTVNGVSVKLASSVDATRVWPVGFPGDKRRTNRANYVAPSSSVVTALGKAGGAAVYEMQFRSPDVNAVYYNPDILYLPWRSASDPTTNMTASTFSGALYDPNLSDTLDLSNITSVKRTWCRTYNGCASETLSFNPAIVYRLTAGADPTKAASYTQYDLNDSANYAAAKSHANRTDCDATGQGGKCTRAKERQNFANWFTYYRIRENMTKAALGRTLGEYQDKIRVGWAQFNYTDNGVVTTSARVQRGIKPMTLDVLKQTLKDIYAIQSYSSTPTRLVLDDIGAYFKKTDKDSPWLTTPGTADSGSLSCRRSANFLLTDGYYNDSYTAAGDQDKNDGPAYTGTENPDGYTPEKYVAQRPFIDAPNTYSNTLADVVMQYYKNDLQTGIANRVPPVDGDVAYWQHLTQFMVGLGVTGTLDTSTAAAKAATLDKLTKGTLYWPDPGPAANSAQKIDDMWHASLSTGGDAYSVKNPTELSDAMADAIGKAAGHDAREAGVALNSSSKVQGSYKFVPKYRAVSWTGDLEAFTLDENGAVITPAAWIASTPADGLPAWNSRNLLVWNRDITDTRGGQAASFTWATMGSTNQGLIGAGGTTLTDWVRGDNSNEGSGKTYRARAGKRFGDFVNAPPVYVKDLVDLSYSAIESGYTAYVGQKASRIAGVVFLGGNDGMLHAFNATNGNEILGFLPSAGLAKQATVAAKDYGTPSNFHQFIVDGPHIESDAYIATRASSTAAWSNVVVGTMGAGGTGVYALHVPTSTPTSLTATSVLWERSARDDSDFGYMLGDLSVGKIQGGTASQGWKVFVGNGADSSSGKAVLMVIDLSTGSINKITLDAGAGNGAMGVSLQKNAKNEVVAAYVGDLKGNLWRVDFGSATDTASWKIGFSGQPLTKAVDASGNAQPITTGPLAVKFKQGDGHLVLFGTGKLLTEADADSTAVQSLYTVLDPTAEGASAADKASPFYGITDLRTKLEVRKVTSTTTNKWGTFYVITGNDVDWINQLGWYFDLPKSGQRVIYPVQYIDNDYVFFQTMIPAAKAAECEVTSGSGVNYIFAANSGLPPQTPMVDTNGDGKIDGSDEVVGGYDVTADGTDALIVPPDSECKDGFKIVWDFSTDPNGKQIRLPCGTDALKIVDRVWRELVTPPKP